jgi:AraC-like DNA-binding protein
MELKEHVSKFETAHVPRVLIAGIARDRPGTEYGIHTLSHPEINYISSGSMVGELNGQPFQNAGGHAYLYYPGDVICGRGDPTKGPFVCRWVRFTWPNADSPSKTEEKCDGDPFHVTLPRDTELRVDARREVQSIFDALLEVHDAGQSAWQLVASGYLLALIGALMCETARTGEARPGAAIDRRLGKACAYMEQNFPRRMKISEIAAATHLTEDYFSRLFMKQMGQSPLQYLIRLRVQEGRRLLVHEPGLTIREASLRAGLDDPKYFSQLFRKHFGLSPDEFRKTLASRFGRDFSRNGVMPLSAERH